MLLIKKHKVTDIREGFLDKTEVFHIFKSKRTLPPSKVITGKGSERREEEKERNLYLP